MKTKKKRVVISKKKTSSGSRKGRLLNGKKNQFATSFLEKIEIDDLKKYEEFDDNKLVDITRKQNIEAYKILFGRYEKSLFIYIFHFVRNKEEAEDLLQNVFAKTYKSIHSFDTSRKFSSWIYRIAHNETINFLKRKNKKRFISLEDISSNKDKLQMSFEGKGSEELFWQKEISKQVDEALERIPDNYKKILKMRYFNDYSYQKIGLILSKPVNTVGTLISRAKKKLLEVIEEEK